MKLIKISGLFLLFSLFTASLSNAQDAVLIDTGNFVRGTIQGTDYSIVTILKDDQVPQNFKAKDIKEFLWNGESYVSKPVFIKNKMEYRFFKVIEAGAVNLYTAESGMNTEAGEPSRSRVRPSIGIGGGSGGFGGVGLGGVITIGGGRRQAEKADRIARTFYYIEKFGTGPLQDISPDGPQPAAQTQRIKNVLLQKLTGDDALSERIKATQSFDKETIITLVQAYNESHK